MRLIFTILLFCGYAANATNYYVDTAGNNSNNGLSTATAWKTISKVNSFSLSTGFLPGDSILFKRGQTWVDTLRIHSSGTLASPIIFSSYGTGNKPIISAFYQVPNSAWTDSSNIWSATVSNAAPQLNTVMIDGQLRAKGRYPNTGYMATNANSLNQWKIYNVGTPHLSQDYSGGQIVFREYFYIHDNPFIDSTKGVGDTMYLRTPLTYAGSGADKYFIENTVKVLDTIHEWSFDSAHKKLYVYSLDTPNVQISIFDTSVISRRKDYITFDKIKVEGSNAVGICIDTSYYNTIQNCTVQNTGGWYTDVTKFGSGAGGAGIRAQYSNHVNINNDSILNSLNVGINAIHVCDTPTINNNYVYNAGYMLGMGSQGNAAYIGINQNGVHAQIRNNTVANTGYHGIYFSGIYDTLYRNRVDSFNLNSEDGGGIYTFNITCTSCLVRANIISNGIGTFGDRASALIYFDGFANHITADSNTLYNGRLYSLLLNGSSYCNIRSNTVYASGASIYTCPTCALNSTNITDNILYQHLLSDPIYYVGVINGVGNSNIVSDSNYILREVGSTNKLFYYGQNHLYYSLTDWRTYSGFEINSKTAPSGITTALPLLYTNPTLSDSTISLTGLYYDAKGNPFNNSVTIHPFQSALLFKAIQDIIPPVPNGHLKVKQKFR